MITKHLLHLAEIFYRSAIKNPHHPAIIIDQKIFIYDEVLSYTKALARLLLKYHVKRVGIFAGRTIDAYIGILAAHWIGIGYVPLNPSFPTERLMNIIQQSAVDIILVDQKRLERIEKEKVFQTFHYVQFDYCNDKERVLTHHQATFTPLAVNADSLAYLMFTSGSTGKPKGVPISFYNLSYFIHAIKDRYPLHSSDRVAQFSHLTFDNSILEMSIAWYYGATLIVVPEETLLAPFHFIRDHQITFWFSVPSVISSLQKLNLLKENVFPSLKYSVFGGEALYFHLAKAWQFAAKDSQIENLYGPTEATVYCFAHCYEHPPADNHFKMMPIGKPFPLMKAAILSDTFNFLKRGQRGELAISGPQIGDGYWQDVPLSKKKYIDRQERKWYLTGDYCYEDNNGIFHFLGRLDNQFKIYGQRIELEEIEYYLREISHMNLHVTVKKKDSDLETEIIAVASANSSCINFQSIRNQLQKYLPHYALPTKLIYLDEFPLNTNGKLDRKELTRLVNLSTSVML